MEGVAVDFVLGSVLWSSGAPDFCWGGVGRLLTCSRLDLGGRGLSQFCFGK